MKFTTKYSADSFYQMYKKGTLQKELQEAPFLQGDNGITDSDTTITFDPVVTQKIIHHDYYEDDYEIDIGKDMYSSNELFYMKPDKFDKKIMGTEELSWCSFWEEKSFSYNEMLSILAWEPANPILKVLFYMAKLSIWMWRKINFIICFILKIVAFVIALPFAWVTLAATPLFELLNQLKYDRNFHYGTCLANSYIKALLIIISITTAPFWIPALWGMLRYGDGSDPALMLGGALFGVLVFFYFTGGGIVGIAGVLGLFVGHGYVEYNMAKHNHPMKEEDLVALDDGLTSALIGLGVSRFLNNIHAKK